MRPVKAAERDVFAARQGTGHHTKNLAGSVATSFDRSLALAALSASGSKPQPRGEVLLGPPLGQIRTNFADELQNAVLAMGGQCRQILGATDLRKNLPQIRDIRRIDARPRARFSCLCRSGRWRRLRVRHLAKDDRNLAIAGGNEALIMVPALNGLREGEQMFLGPVAAQRFDDALSFDVADSNIA
jgi:hypothetical protein